MESNHWKREYRNQYVRLLLNILLDKYHVQRPKLARAMGYRVNHMSDFSRGTRNLSNDTLDNIEAFIFDLYGPILKDELEINKVIIREIGEANKKAEREDMLNKKRAKDRESGQTALLD